jgi:hypothetical protein
MLMNDRQRRLAAVCDVAGGSYALEIDTCIGPGKDRGRLALAYRYGSRRELIRMTGGNFRLITRLLTQIERVLSVNDLHLVSNAVIEAARDSLVIGPG